MFFLSKSESRKMIWKTRVVVLENRKKRTMMPMVVVLDLES
ncbi:hypothetical protein Goari_008026, partial [Gossypium aridum]|nr:hypothetical protein [Gossypium aridum]